MILENLEKILPWEREIVFTREVREFAAKVLEAFSNGSGPPRWMRPERFFSLIDDLERVTRGEQLYFTEKEKEKVRKRIESWLRSLKAFQKKGPTVFERDGLVFDLSALEASEAEREILSASLKESRLYGLRKVPRSRIEKAREKTAIVFGSEPISDTISLLLMGFRKLAVESDQSSEEVLKKIERDNDIEIRTFYEEAEEREAGLVKIERGGREIQLLFALEPLLEKEKPITVVRVDLSASTFLEAPKFLKRICQSTMKFYDLNPIEPFRDKLLICY